MFCDEVDSSLGIVTGVSRYDRKVFFVVVVVCMFVHNMFILYAFQGFFFLLHFLQSLTTF